MEWRATESYRMSSVRRSELRLRAQFTCFRVCSLARSLCLPASSGEATERESSKFLALLLARQKDGAFNALGASSSSRVASSSSSISSGAKAALAFERRSEGVARGRERGALFESRERSDKLDD